MALYEDLKAVNIIPQVARFMPNHAYKMVYNKESNDHQMVVDMYPSVAQPWIHVKKCDDRLCQYWYDVLFSAYKLLPIGCTGCWKVCVKLQTLKQLMAVYKLQQTQPVTACKCGMDQRPWNDCLYGAYWYQPLAGGLETARKNWAKINKLVHKHVDPKLTVILKRGCTEMELMAGPSDQWHIPQDQYAYEKLLAATYKPVRDLDPQPEQIQVNIMQQWIEWAMKNGDKTYLDYVDKPLCRPLVYYHKSAHSPKDFPVQAADLSYEKVEPKSSIEVM